MKYIISLLLAFNIGVAYSQENKLILPEGNKSDTFTNDDDEMEDNQPEQDEAIFHIVEKMPEYPGGQAALMQFISNNLVLPDTVADGRVLVKFVIDKSGYVRDAQVIKSVSPKCDKASLDVINKLARFSPGTQQGKPVSVYFIIPIRFVLTE